MWRHSFILVLFAFSAVLSARQQTAEELTEKVFATCGDMGCVKREVLGYLDDLLGIKSDAARSLKNIDGAIMKRVARVFKTHEFRYALPEILFGSTDVVLNPWNGLNFETKDDGARGLLKKKLLFPFLLLLKLKMKLLMPLFVALIGLKAFVAYIKSKLAILIVLAFVAYNLLSKSGMPMPMSMAPAEPPMSLYGPPMPSTSPPSSYEPGWQPDQGGPYSRVWNPSNNNNNEPQIAYSAYYPGDTSSSTSRP